MVNQIEDIEFHSKCIKAISKRSKCMVNIVNEGIFVAETPQYGTMLPGYQSRTDLNRENKFSFTEPGYYERKRDIIVTLDPGCIQRPRIELSEIQPCPEMTALQLARALFVSDCDLQSNLAQEISD